MAANQIPLLKLSQIEPNGDSSDDADLTRRIEAYLNAFGKAIARISGGPFGPKENVPMALFSDPNDVLTYELPKDALGDWRTNVRISIVTSYGLFADPFGAHTGYLEEKRVWRTIGCGRPDRC